MLLTIIFHYNVIRFATGFLFLHIIIISALLLLNRSRSENAVLKWLRFWNPVIIIPINFSELHYLVHSVNPVDMDDLLIAIDRFLFGVDPTVWMERWLNPILTEYLQWIYVTFYFLPIILAIIVYRKNQMERFDFFIFVIVLGYYLSYIGYFLVPAIGPRFTLEHLQTVPLTGVWLTQGIRETLNALENIQRDAFPSGHTEMTFLTMIFAYKYSKRYFYVLLLIGNSLIFSTVYLRYHYVIDVFAGIFLAIVVVFIAKPLYAFIKAGSRQHAE